MEKNRRIELLIGSVLAQCGGNSIIVILVYLVDLSNNDEMLY